MIALGPSDARPGDRPAPARALPFSVQRLDELDLDGVAHEPVRELADEDLAGGRGLLEASGDVDRVAGDEALSGGRVARRRPHRCSRRSEFSSATPQRALAARRFTLASASLHLRRRPARRAAHRPRGARGSPNTAMMASPMNFSTVPPWRSMLRAHRVEVDARVTSRSDSLSSCSPRLVESFRSEKTIVTVLRALPANARLREWCATHPQMRKRSGFCSPHCWQTVMPRVYGRRQPHRRRRQRRPPTQLPILGAQHSHGERALHARDREDARVGRGRAG